MLPPSISVRGAFFTGSLTPGQGSKVSDGLCRFFEPLKPSPCPDNDERERGPQEAEPLATRLAGFVTGSRRRVVPSLSSVWCAAVPEWSSFPGNFMAKLLLPAVRVAAAVMVELSWSNVGEDGGGAGLYREEVGGSRLGFGRAYLQVACKNW